jgi:cysteine-rich repeat protein
LSFPDNVTTIGSRQRLPSSSPTPPSGTTCTCNVFCQPPACGNGVIEAPFEQGDDGNTINNDSCTNQCQFNWVL